MFLCPYFWATFQVHVSGVAIYKPRHPLCPVQQTQFIEEVELHVGIKCKIRLGNQRGMGSPQAQRQGCAGYLDSTWWNVLVDLVFCVRNGES